MIWFLIKVVAVLAVMTYNLGSFIEPLFHGKVQYHSLFGFFCTVVGAWFVIDTEKVKLSQ